jgi:hypothetical protein
VTASAEDTETRADVRNGSTAPVQLAKGKVSFLAESRSEFAASPLPFGADSVEEVAARTTRGVFGLNGVGR